MTVPVDNLAPLRIGIIVDSFMQPRWLRQALEKIFAANVSRLELVIKVPPREPSRKSLLYKLYERVDRRFFKPAPDALELVNVDDLIGSLPILAPDDLEKIRGFRLDVLLYFGPNEATAEFANLATYGVWFYAFGTDRKAPPGFQELLTQAPLTISSVRSLSGQPPTERIVYQSISPTLSRFSAGLNNNIGYWKAAAFVARSLVDLYRGRNGPVHDTGRGNGAVATPTNAAMTRMFFNLSGRAVARGLEKISSFEQWVLAYRMDQSEFQYLDPPAGRFWADPFPIKVEGRYYIFFEEYLDSAGRAHISVVAVDRNGIVNGPTAVLKLDCHLSYPFVFKWRGDYYMIPETGDRNVVELYRANSFPFEWQPEKVLLEARCPLDATLMEVDGTWWMFVNIQEEGVVVNWDEVHLYHAESPLGPWQPHVRNPVISDVRSARPAGRLFWSGDVLYRPSQDSSMRYGYATTISKITALSPTEYSETPVAKILPDWDKDVLGVHTLNTFDEITVIDCLAKRSRLRSGKLRPPPRLGKVEDLLLARSSVVS